jgi:hypothetical protein
MFLIVIALLAAFGGFAALCATTHRQMRQIWRTPPSASVVTLIRIVGWSTLALSLAPCIAWWRSGYDTHWTQGMGVVAWVCLLPAVALALVFLFAFANRIVILLGGGSGILAWTLSIAWAFGLT